MNAPRAGLPPIPEHMRELPLDARGYPVPFFAAMIDGQPDFRIADSRAITWCMKHAACWICGHPLGRFKAFTIGPMCAITRTISEPPQHLDCAQFAACACPFLTLPRAKRTATEGRRPENVLPPAGIAIQRNPGAVCVWVTLSFRPFQRDGGYLFRLGDPTSLYWYAEGRPATREEVDESIASGLPLLQELAQKDGPSAVQELERYVRQATELLDATLPSPNIERPA